MSNAMRFKTFALAPLAIAALAASQGAFAHTRLETPVVPEGTRVHNQVVIGHGCGPTGHRTNPTYGTTVVFPNAVSFKPIIGVDSTEDGVVNPVLTSKSASSLYSPLSGIGKLIHTGGAFPAESIKADSLGNHDGFWAGGKYYDQTISTPINVDFYSAAVNIVTEVRNNSGVITTRDSCARSVTFELAIVDICNISTPAAIATDDDLMVWSPIPSFVKVGGKPISATNKFSNYDGYADTAHKTPGDGWGSPATLTVTRDLVKHPIPSYCRGNNGAGDDVYVYPSAQQINKELPVWSNPDQTGSRYWPR